MKKIQHTIAKVLPGSIAEELELEPGDILVSINDMPVEDIFDYQYLLNEEYAELLIQKKNGEEWVLEVEKEYEEDLGIEFENSLMDEYRSCTNKCIFCFIDQMPPGMRETLYFKDDDSRLSFLQGNYVTLTNMSDHDLDRIIKYHLSPINISFQTMNPELRCKMLHNRFAGDSLKKVEKLYEAGIRMNGQIVLCKGVNDKEELQYTMEKLSAYAPLLESVSIVPVGLTKYREGLYPLQAFTKEDAKEVLKQVRGWQEKMYREHQIHFVHASDEWYILAEEELPEEACYDGYLQYENGVGMLRLLEEEVKAALEARTADERKQELSIATGCLAAPFIRMYADWIQDKFRNVKIHVYPVVNEFFGERITVSGLITGQDLRKQLRDKPLGEKLLIPCNMLRSGEQVFLDDDTVEAISGELKVPIVVTDTSGEDFVNAVLESPETIGRVKRRQIYEQTDCGDCRTS